MDRVRPVIHFLVVLAACAVIVFFVTLGLGVLFVPQSQWDEPHGLTAAPTWLILTGIVVWLYFAIRRRVRRDTTK